MHNYNDLEKLEVEIFQLGETLSVTQSELAQSVVGDLELLNKDEYSDRATNLVRQKSFLNEMQGDIRGVDFALTSDSQENVKIYLGRLLVDVTGLANIAWLSAFGRKSGDPAADQYRKDMNNARIEQYRNVGERSPAGVAASPLSETPGGIDFNPNTLNLAQQGQPINFTMDNSMLQNLQSSSVYGIQPVIINIAPITNFMPLLGMVDSEDEQQLSQI